MDIRNFKEVPKIDPDKILDHIFELGKDQFEGYKGIEGLPNYPFDVNNPANQIILKDFISRVIEELIEGYYSTEEINAMFSKFGWNIDLLTNEEYTEVLNSAQNANEEQADALGFWVTLFMYSNILPEDIFEWSKVNLSEYEKVLGLKYSSLNSVMTMGITMFVKNNSEIPFILQRSYPIIDRLYFDTQEEYDRIIEYTPAFQGMSEESHKLEKDMLFDIIAQLNLARNLLKSRPWKNTQVMTKELEYQNALVTAFYMYMGFLAMFGFDDVTLHKLFYRKYMLNKWRQNSNY